MLLAGGLGVGGCGGGAGVGGGGSRARSAAGRVTQLSILVLGAFSTGVFNTNALPRINIGADV